MFFSVTLVPAQESQLKTCVSTPLLAADGNPASCASYDDAIAVLRERDGLSDININSVCDGPGKLFSAKAPDSSEVNFWLESEPDCAEWFERSFDFEGHEAEEPPDY